jgi:hypothetical protein
MGTRDKLMAVIVRVDFDSRSTAQNNRQDALIYGRRIALHAYPGVWFGCAGRDANQYFLEEGRSLGSVAITHDRCCRNEEGQ